MNRWAVLATLSMAAAAGTASAHQKSVSYSKWTLSEGGATVQVKVSWFDLTSLPAFQESGGSSLDASATIRYLERHLLLQTAAGACRPIEGSGVLLPAERGWTRVEWRVRCDGSPTALQSDLFRALANHVHLATVLGSAETDLVLSSTSPTAAFDPLRLGPRHGGFYGFVALGVEHILTGWDHLAFLFLLIVIARRVREVVLLVTGFTVGHSITLGAAALGAVVPNPRAVEAVIAASILIVALENVNVERARGGLVLIGATLLLFAASASAGALPAFWGLALFTACYFALLRLFAGAGRLRWAIACLFGFVHGLGFSGVLLEQELPRAKLVAALFSFNLGVELGQLAIVAAIWPLLRWLRRRDYGPSVVDATSVAGAALGTFALVVRAFS